jgi:seryl-tRNA synthetase
LFFNIYFYRLAACSRCYRAELPGGKSEGNLYRVHEFIKVEMFAVTTDDNDVSHEMHNEIVRLQTLMFEELGLHFRILDMPTEELGLSAHRKYDIEAWMQAKAFYGEVSLTTSIYVLHYSLI